jgi:hypothetical protein
MMGDGWCGNGAETRDGERRRRDPRAHARRLCQVGAADRPRAQANDELGYDEIRLYTNQRFAENIEFYRRLGCRVDREEGVKAGIVVHMSKPL